MNKGKTIRNIFKCQNGAFSPFMFGMLLGVGILSAVSQQWANKYSKTIEENRVTRAKSEANAIKLAMENAILLEDSSDYSNSVTTFGNLNNRVLQQAGAVGKTRSDSNFQIKSIDSTTDLGIQNKRVVIAATDDAFVRSDVADLNNLTDIINYEPKDNQAVEIFDSGEVRKRQVDSSYEFLVKAADNIYNYYAGNLIFPDGTEYATLAGITNLKDVWGNSFVYLRGDEYAVPIPLPAGGQVGTITMTTPWGYTRTIQLDMNIN